jgi:hypothetical protein
MKDMPTIDFTLPPFTSLNEEQRRIGEAIAANRKGVVRLRASKPPLAPKNAPFKEKLFRGSVSYVWRMVAFMTSPRHQHQCMPVSAEWDLPFQGYSNVMTYAQTLDVIVDAVMDCIPRDQWIGIMRWGRILGATSTRN